MAAVSLSVAAQNIVTGTVKNGEDFPVLGAVVSVVGDPARSVLTDKDGVFTIEADKGEYIEIKYVDRCSRVWVNGQKMDIDLEAQDVLTKNRGVNTTFVNQTQAISVISGEQIMKNSSPDVSNALYGLLPGLTVQQNTDYDGKATLSIRGKMGRSPLIVVDGIPRNLEYLNAVEIESVQVLKDGPATALWGMRGASGISQNLLTVILMLG